jgi:hypothetical protein
MHTAESGKTVHKNIIQTLSSALRQSFTEHLRQSPAKLQSTRHQQQGRTRTFLYSQEVRQPNKTPAKLFGPSSDAKDSYFAQKSFPVRSFAAKLPRTISSRQMADTGRTQ